MFVHLLHPWKCILIKFFEDLITFYIPILTDVCAFIAPLEMYLFILAYTTPRFAVGPFYV